MQDSRFRRGADITFMSLRYPLPERDQRNLMTLAASIKVARESHVVSIAEKSQAKFERTKKRREEADLALKEYTDALRENIGVSITRPQFLPLNPA